MSRREVWLARWSATMVVLLAVAVVGGLSTLVSLPLFSLDEVSASRVVMATIGCALLAAFRPLEQASQPLLVLILVTPWVAYISSIVLWVGRGTPSILFLVVFVTVPAFVYATVGGMRGADPAGIDRRCRRRRPSAIARRPR